METKLCIVKDKDWYQKKLEKLTLRYEVEIGNLRHENKALKRKLRLLTGNSNTASLEFPNPVAPLVLPSISMRTWPGF